MRNDFLIDGNGKIRLGTMLPLPAGFLRVGIAHTGAEITFQRGSVAWPAFTKMLNLLASFRPKRVALRLLSESNAPIRIFPTVWEFAQHAEALALPSTTVVHQTGMTSSGARALMSRFSFLRSSMV